MRLGVSAALVGGRIEPGDVEVADGEVVAVGLSPATGHGAGLAALAAPGLVDLQVNGFAGVDLLHADRAGWNRVGEALARHGTTAYQPTFISAPEADVVAALRAMPGRSLGARVLGAHLEGPFLASARRGTHRPEHLRRPDRAALGRLLDAGPVTQVTLAPELPGAHALIDALVSRGIRVSVGHTDATAADAHAAFDRGVRTVTHLHNAMGPGSPREPGAATAALVRPDVILQLIADGHHLAEDTLRLAWRAAGGRLALVSDAAAAAPRAAPIRDVEGRLAGSGSTLLDGVRTLHRLGVPVADALLAATAVPARLLGRADVGGLVPGARADVIVLDDRLKLHRVLLAGVDVGTSVQAQPGPGESLGGFTSIAPPMDAPLVVAGPTLSLRYAAAEDAPALLGLASDPAVTRFFSWGPYTRVEQPDAYIASLEGKRERGELLDFLTVHSAHGPIGVTGLSELSRRDRRATVGSWFGHRWWGSGANLESKALVANLAFEHLGFERLTAWANTRNGRSQVALERCGFRREGVLAAWHRHGDRLHDVVVFGMVRGAYERSRLARIPVKVTGTLPPAFAVG